MVVVLNSSVQLMATVSTSGVLAEEKRRVAVRRFAEARKPPTGESRASGGPRTPAATRATTGPRQPTATHEEQRGHLRGRRRGVRGAGGGRDGEQRRRAGERDAARRSRGPGRAAAARPRRRPARGSAARARRAARRRARRAARRATPPPTAAAIGSQPALTARFGGAMPWRTSPSASARPRMAPGQMPRRRADEGDDHRLPGDHAADLAGRRGHGSQERDLALALLDRQAHRAGHDEDRDEQRQAAERRGDGDQRGARLPGARATRPCRGRRR